MLLVTKTFSTSTEKLDDPTVNTWTLLVVLEFVVQRRFPLKIVPVSIENEIIFSTLRLPFLYPGL
jgi:hypothetical protein